MFNGLIFGRRVNAVAFFEVTIIGREVVRHIRVSKDLPGDEVRGGDEVGACSILIRRRRALPPVLLSVVLRLRSRLAMVMCDTRSIVSVAKQGCGAVLFAIQCWFLGGVFLYRFLVYLFLRFYYFFLFSAFGGNRVVYGMGSFFRWGSCFYIRVVEALEGLGVCRQQFC